MPFKCYFLIYKTTQINWLVTHYVTQQGIDMSNYIHKRKETYHYRRRVPKQLQSYFPSLFYTKSLSKDMISAKAIASTISLSIDIAVTMHRLNKKPDLSLLIQVSKEPLPTITDLSSNYFKTLSVTKGK